jgi:hypothetical protein
MLIEKEVDFAIAAEDLIVYKALSIFSPDYFCSIYRSFGYKVGQLYKTKITRSTNGTVFDYQDDVTYENFDHKELIYISKGFHAANKKNRLSHEVDDDTKVLVECIIPKGSRYYTNRTGCVVSNQIIVTGKIVKDVHVD